MTQHSKNTNLTSSIPGATPDLQRFSHQAMATTFEIFIIHPESRYARQGAFAAFDELDRLESELSCFIENSDVSRINNLAVNEPLQISLPTFECLQIARRMYDETNGAFDVTVGALLECWSNKDKSVRSPRRAQLEEVRKCTSLVELDENEHTVKLSAESIKVDLGGIGKGYAVDKMAELLAEWNIKVALINGGYSSVLAMDAPPGTNGWPITFSNPTDIKQTLTCFRLWNQAVGASGLLKGEHIIDPRTARGIRGNIAAWAVARDAATADALSTAFMVMRPEQINQYCQGHPDAAAMIITAGPDTTTQTNRICRYGRWKTDDLPKG